MRVKRWSVSLVLAVVWGLGGCGGRAYDPDVDGQSHWWRRCEMDSECGTGLECACGVCTKSCSEASTCAGAGEQHACVAAVPWCPDQGNGAVCAASCERASDCPMSGRCEQSVCVPSALDSGEASSAQNTLSDAGVSTSSLDAEAHVQDAGACPSAECRRPPPGFCETLADSRDAALATEDPELLEQWLAWCGEAGAASSDSAPTSSDAGSTSTDVSWCGNGLLEPGEQCDDGNEAGADGCTRDCTIEAGYQCGTPGAPCSSQ